MSELGVWRVAARGHRLVHDYPAHPVFRAGAVFGVDAGFAPGAEALADGGPVVPVGVGISGVEDLRVVCCGRSVGVGGGVGESVNWGGVGGAGEGEGGEEEEKKGKERCQHVWKVYISVGLGKNE